MNTLDMRGNPCPIPVIKAKKELADASSQGVAVLVDNIVAVQNLQKMADGLGHSFTYIPQDEETYLVTIYKQGEFVAQEESKPTNLLVDEKEGVTVLITSNQMGSGSEELGKILIKGFVFSLTELAPPPKAVLFLNSGVQLTVQDSNVLADLLALAAKGTTVLSCGTCLNYYALTDKLAVGKITDMFGITTALASAAHLITL